jgi:pimeloyl-ACP methyl ester carboxylesterase
MAQLKLDGSDVGYESTGDGARGVSAPGAGHYVPVEQPDATTAALRDLVTAVASTGTGRAARVG